MTTTSFAALSEVHGKSAGEIRLSCRPRARLGGCLWKLASPARTLAAVAVLLTSVEAFSQSSGEFWRYVSPFAGGGTKEGVWAVVKQFSESTVNARLGPGYQCAWASPEPGNPQVGQHLGNWGGTQPSGAPCTGNFVVNWVAPCGAGTKWESAANACVPIVEVDTTQTPPSNGDACYANPIYPLRGTKREVVDLRVGIGWVGTGLTYDTSARAPTTSVVVGRSTDAAPASFGELWSSSLHRKLVVAANLKAARAARGNGQLISFVGNGVGLFASNANSNEKLLSVNGGYRYIDAANQTLESYDNVGVLTRIDRASGQSLSFTYSSASTSVAVAPGPGYLIDVTDSFGRNIAYTYNAAGLVNQITDPAGQVIAALYTGGYLTALVWQDGQLRQFRYENTSFRWAVTGIIDESFMRKGTYGYDASGRAVSTEGAGGVNRFSVSYASPPAVTVSDTYNAVDNVVYRVRTWQTPSAPVVTTPYGNSLALGVALVANSPVVTTRSQPAGSGCMASTSNMGYDANGNVDLEDDFNGSRVCRKHDLGRNLETMRVEGLANTQACVAVTVPGAALPAGSRKVSTDWHPDWRLPRRTAEPGRRTTLIYNGQPDPFNSNAIASCAPASVTLPDGKPIALLCRQVEQATTDPDGSQGFNAALQAGVVARDQRWTYNQHGQVLSHDGPRTDVADITTYTYYADTAFNGAGQNAVGHTVGDLQSMTNAAGQTTTYGLYNRQGQLVQMTDPNGVTTTNAYDLRQRLLSTSTAGLSASYTYDAVGQLVRSTQADGSYTGYAYDAAHRQVAVFDNLGNRIDYTLDNAGNRVAENVKDPGGTLRRQLTRSIDALGRVQQTTGRE